MVWLKGWGVQRPLKPPFFLSISKGQRDFAFGRGAPRLEYPDRFNLPPYSGRGATSSQRGNRATASKYFVPIRDKSSCVNLLFTNILSLTGYYATVPYRDEILVELKWLENCYVP